MVQKVKRAGRQQQFKTLNDSENNIKEPYSSHSYYKPEVTDSLNVSIFAWFKILIFEYLLLSFKDDG